jgi:hypothetical protein
VFAYGTGYFYKQASYDLTQGGPVTVNLALRFGGTLVQGVVTNASTGAPIPGVQVQLSGVGGRVTGPDGSYAFDATGRDEAQLEGFTIYWTNVRAPGYFESFDGNVIQVAPPFPHIRNFTLVPFGASERQFPGRRRTWLRILRADRSWSLSPRPRVTVAADPELHRIVHSEWDVGELHRAVFADRACRTAAR